MADERTAPIFFFAPFVSSTMRVEPEWIDYNGHMNMAYYHVLFDRAVDEAFEVVGLGPDYVEARNASYFTAEVHTLYKRELKVTDLVRVTLQLISFDEKRLHFYEEIRHATEGWVSATCEALSLHVEHGNQEGRALPARHPGEPRGHEGRPHPPAAAEGHRPGDRHPEAGGACGTAPRRGHPALIRH